MKHTLLLASKSPSRQMLLQSVGIPFTTISQDADESQCDWAMGLDKVVQSIALHKMAHALVPAGTQKGDICFVLTADTLSEAEGEIHGKPLDKDDAIKKIKAARNGSRLCTGFCLDRRVWDGTQWVVEQRIQQCVGAEYVFNVPDAWLDTYLNNSIGGQCAGGIAVEGFGGQFLTSLNGSYSAIIGLPLVEVRDALEALGFFI